MKIKPNMYVRTRKGKIGKIIDIILCQEEKRYILDSSSVYIYCEEDISKASYNIIDLIEVGDYVNDELVKNIEVDSYKDYVINSGYWCKQEEIKSIVTKEMFSNVEYRVETN